MTGIDEAISLGRPARKTRPDTISTISLPGKLWKMRAWLGYLLATAAIFAGWAGRHERNISAEDGLGYLLGIVGASMMAALLIYPLRKRIPSLRVLGATRHWFRIHMFLGIAGPVLILYHSNFNVSSLNSRVALFCTLLVACSGIVGRYFYSKIHNGLYGEKTNLRSLVGEMHQSLERLAGSSQMMGQLMDQLKALDDAALEPPADLVQSLVRPFRFSFETRKTYWKLKRQIRSSKAFGVDETTQAQDIDRRAHNDLLLELRNHLKRVRRITQLGFFERLFSLWHILHLPFFFMLVLSAIVHVLAVHMY